MYTFTNVAIIWAPAGEQQDRNARPGPMGKSLLFLQSTNAATNVPASRIGAAVPVAAAPAAAAGLPLLCPQRPQLPRASDTDCLVFGTFALAACLAG